MTLKSEAHIIRQADEMPCTMENRMARIWSVGQGMSYFSYIGPSSIDDRSSVTEQGNAEHLVSCK
jgi:hypothetical protein